VPDLRGRVIAGLGGGTGGSSLLTNQSGGLNGDTMRDTGGAETHTLTEAQLAAHGHRLLDRYTDEEDQNNSTVVGVGGQSSYDNSTTSYITSNSEGDVLVEDTGSDTAHNNVQPTMILTWCIKT
ncbi:MAG: phage tail protein, partial [Betaproteobacteria bacterium]